MAEKNPITANPVLQVDPLGGQMQQAGIGQAAAPAPRRSPIGNTTKLFAQPGGKEMMSPGVQTRFQRRIREASSDEALWQIVKDAWLRHGVDFSHLVHGTQWEK